MDPLLTLAFLVFLDVILILGLSYYHKRLGYGFLKYGALALGAEVVIQILEYKGITREETLAGAVAVGAVEIAYAGCLVAGVADIFGRVFPARWVTTMGALFVLAGLLVYAGLLGGQQAQALLLLPPSALLMSVIYILVRYRHSGSIGEPWLAGMLAMHVGFTWGAQFSVHHTELIRQMGWIDDIMLVLAGGALVMITSERAIQELVRRDERLEEFKQERRRLELQFSHAQKLESLGALAGGIAHDFNNMLTSILGYTSLAMKKLPNDSEIRKDLYMVMSGARQAVDLTSQMLIYAGKGVLEFEAVDISKVVDGMSSLIHSIVPRKIQLIRKLARDLPAVKGDRIQLGQVLMNLIANAVDAIEDNTGTITVTTGLIDVDRELLRLSLFSHDREPGAYLYLSVKDTGIGLGEDQIERIFDPFYSEKQTNKGLGLSSLSGIVRQHNGFIGVGSQPGEGSEFTVYFPVLSYQESGSDGRTLVRPAENFKGNVLLADDDPRIRSLMASILEGDYFKLTSAEDGKEALRIFEERAPQFDLLVLDCTMPKMSGPEVYRKIREAGFKIPVVLVSGYHQEQVIANISNDPHASFIQKPFNVDDFLQSVLAALKTAQTV